MKKTLLAVLGGAVMAVTSLFMGTKAQVQPVLNPTQYSFLAPADYDDSFVDGTKKVVSITTDFLDAGVIVFSTTSGHPAKDAAGYVTIGIARGSLALDKPYTLVARAVNALDATSSDPSVTIVWSNTKPGKPGTPKPCVGNGSNRCP